MGTYLNPGAEMLRQGRRSKIYVDKSELIAYLNSVIGTEGKYVCVSRPRRFGKTMAANMVCAYYDRTVDGAAEFTGLRIASEQCFDAQRNRYDVLHINMQEFLSESSDVKDMLHNLQQDLMFDLTLAYGHLLFRDKNNLSKSMADIYGQIGRQFVIVIDEWDCVMREHEADDTGQRLYLDFLRAWLKDKPYVALCYMTGILPIKKYGTHSALNMFAEFSMVEPDEMASYMGFTEAEVDSLCSTWHRDLNECRAWYDGYQLEGVRGGVYAPRSVVRAMETGRFASFWTRTETFEALRKYIDLNLDGLHDKVVELVSGAHVPVNTETYANDMTTFHSADDVLTLLVHLGYLSYDAEHSCAVVPNREVLGEWANATADSGWAEVARSIRESERLLNALLEGKATAVASGVEQAHEDAASVIAYNNENSLACTLRLAFFSAIRKYKLVREAPAGKGYADLVMVPLHSSGAIPGVVVELKWGSTPERALEQIRERDYARAFAGTPAEGNVILCGISYDPKSKTHQCAIER